MTGQPLTRVHVKLSTTLRDCVPDYVPAKGLDVALSSPATVEGVARHVGLPLEDIKIVMRNGVHADLPDPVTDGDRVAFFPAVGGG